VRGYNDAWVAGDVDGCAAFLDRESFHWDGGAFTYDDVDTYMEGFKQFRFWRGEQRILGELYGPEEAAIIYDLASPIVGPIRAAELFSLRNARINRITLVWDPTRVRESQAQQGALVPSQQP
jgi:hypothetical protein